MSETDGILIHCRGKSLWLVQTRTYANFSNIESSYQWALSPQFHVPLKHSTKHCTLRTIGPKDAPKAWICTLFNLEYDTVGAYHSLIWALNTPLTRLVILRSY